MNPWARQADLLMAVARSTKRRIAVRSGHKVAKTNSFAVLALWWFATRDRARVVMTSAGNNQIATQLWPEVRKMYARGADVLGGEISIGPHTGIRHPDGRLVFGFSTQDPVVAAGQSGDQLLYLVDEASGVEEPVLEAIKGNLAGGGTLVLGGNPTATSGSFFDAFHDDSDLWDLRHISSEETPNVTGIGERVPGLATLEYVELARKEWGEDSPLYQVRVKGNFPTQGTNSIIGLALVDEAKKRKDVKEEGRLEFGVDVARFGDDDSVITPRRGMRKLESKVIHGQDTVQVAGAVVKYAKELRLGNEKVRVKVDVIGVGAGVADHLRALNIPWLEVIDINVAESATAVDEVDGVGYSTLRDQLWFGVRDWLKAGGAIDPDGELEGELVAPTYSFDARGRIKVESKESMKKRLRRSPDRADALALAVYEPVVLVTTAKKWAGSKLTWGT